MARRNRRRDGDDALQWVDRVRCDTNADLCGYKGGTRANFGAGRCVCACTEGERGQERERSGREAGRSPVQESL